MQGLWDAAQAAFGRVDIWINNAGITHTTKVLAELDSAEIKPVIDTNITGMIYGSQVALRGMIMQGFGQLYNMEGHGSNDKKRPGLSIYGTSKRALKYFHAGAHRGNRRRAGAGLFFKPRHCHYRFSD